MPESPIQDFKAPATNSGKKRKVWARTENQLRSNTIDLATNESLSALKSNSINSSERVNKKHPNRAKTTVYINSKKNSNTDRIPTMGKRSTGRGGTEVKISFGPSRPPSTSSSNGGGNGSGRSTSTHHQHSSHLPPSSAAAAASMAAMMSGAHGNISFGDINLDELKEKAAAAAADQKAFRNKNGLPCTEAEMKALMSMFVEIMGMSMNNNSKEGGNGSAPGVGTFNSGNIMYSNGDDRNFHHSANSNSNPRSSHPNGDGPVFSFGANPMDASSLAVVAAAASGAAPGMIPDHMAAATAGFFADGASWEALRRTYAAAEQMALAEDDDEDDEDFENRELTFEELEFLLHHRKQKEEAAKLASQFASGDWESLEQVAINDHLMSATDDKERKAAKKREKKQRRKAKLKEEAAQKAAEAAQKKREKAIVSWRSRVVSACQSNEVAKLDGLLQESPLRKLMEENKDNETNRSYLSTSCIIPHLEFLLPNSVAKNRTQVERGTEARLRLAEYILHTELSLAFKPLRTGRTALHTACFHGDLRFLQLLLEKTESYTPKEGENPILESFLDLRCNESGWSPIHYASMSGSSEILELLLARGCDLSTTTDVTHTWRESDGRGVTARELVQSIQSGSYDDEIETHGLALQEVKNSYLNHDQARRLFMKKLDRVDARLSNVEKNGYTPLSKDKSDSLIDSELQIKDSLLSQSEPSSSRHKKKKKKKKKQNGKAESGTSVNTGADQKTFASTQSNSNELKEEEDPLVTALFGMGFNEEQIMAAVKACGGTHRATADDLVTWILGQGDNEENKAESQNFTETTKKKHASKDKNNLSRKGDTMRPNEHNNRQQQFEAAREQEETARRLAAKREEARRRNREWNNREQARQEKEAKAKVALKLYGASRSSIPTLVPRKGLEVSPKSNIHSRMSNGTHRSQIAGKAIAGLKQPGRHSQTANKWGVPPVNKSQSLAVQTTQSNAAPNVASSAARTQGATNEQQILPMSSFFASTNDDDKTVSSFGSSRGMSVSSKEFVPLTSHPSVPPPGFSPTTTQPITAPTRPPVATVPENPSVVSFSDKPRQGEIRATAKEFVPSFTLPENCNSDVSLQRDPTSSNGRSALESSQSFDRGFPNGILQGGSAMNHNSLLGSSLQNGFQNSFEKSPSIISESTEPVAFGSFIEGSKPENSAILIPFQSAQEDITESDIGGSRLLNSISRNKFIGSTSIWGEKQPVPSLEATLHPSFFGDGNLNELDSEENTSSWHIPSGGNPVIPNNSGQGSIW
mmetsp:Transcript_25261/g.59123  ORF Transcript_25261/g.59123 Transcript_25261/m.59123 type:complete len:1270 (+) Transcript_25261:343-4152(+)